MDAYDEVLGAEIRAALRIDDPGGRALEIVAILEAALGGRGPRPVVVGGMAVYIWTESDAFLTADIDIVIPSSPELTAALGRLGFRRAADQRHWELPGTEVLIEAPASAIDSDAVVERVAAPSGRTVGVLSHADLVLERLDEFQATGHQLAAQQAIVLLAGLAPRVMPELTTRAERRRLGHALSGMTRLGEDVRAGRRPAPESDEWHELARQFEAAEYRQGRRET